MTRNRAILLPKGVEVVSRKPRAYLAILALGLVAISSAQAAPYGVNLLVNGNAEDGAFSSTGAPVLVPGWTTSSAFTVVNYGAPGGFPGGIVGSDSPPDHGNQFFAGGNAAASTATQTIDVAANAAEIDTGNAVVDLLGWLGGFGTDPDTAALSVSFLNGNTNLGGGIIGPVSHD